MIEQWNATPVIVDCDDSFDLQMSAFESAFRDVSAVRAIILCSPNNPTGKVFSAERMHELCTFAKMKSLAQASPVLLILDHTYWRLCYSQMSPPPTFPLYDYSILIGSFSKASSDHCSITVP